MSKKEMSKKEISQKEMSKKRKIQDVKSDSEKKSNNKRRYKKDKTKTIDAVVGKLLCGITQELNEHLQIFATAQVNPQIF